MSTQEQNDKGRNFERYALRSGMKYVEIAERLGMAHAQTLNHWRMRGVPTNRAIQVATLLECRPDEISGTIISQAQADEYTGHAAKKREVREALVAVIEEVDDPRALDLILDQAESIRRRFAK